MILLLFGAGFPTHINCLTLGHSSFYGLDLLTETWALSPTGRTTYKMNAKRRKKEKWEKSTMRRRGPIYKVF